MLAVYVQKTGQMFRSDGTLIAQGYSGFEAGLNNPMLQDQPDVGPIPAGLYRIGQPQDTATHGPFVLPLTPVYGTQMFNRSGFLIHGDEIAHPGQFLASRGCIVLSREAREQVDKLGERLLFVVRSER